MIHRNPDDPHSEAWTDQHIAEHKSIHAAQLQAHDGDRESLRRKLKHPAHHAAIAALEDHTPDHWPYQEDYNPPGGLDRKTPKPSKGHLGQTIQHKVR